MAIPLCFYGKARVGDACVALARSLGIEIDQKDDGDSNFNAASYAAVIPTPGVPPKNRAYSGRNILSELDFAHRYLPQGFKIVTVTGTDGKSTTAWMLFEIFRQEYGDGNVFLSGNFEVPFSETVRTIRERGLKRGIIVIEASSFMLHNVGTPSSLAALASLPGGERRWGFSTDYSIFTNFESDHLNWHADLAEYFEDKMRMVRLTGNLAAINEQVRERSRACGLNFTMPSQVCLFGSDSSLPNRTNGEEIVVSGQPETLLLSETRFSGLHNALNVLSCAVVACAMEIPLERIRQHLKNVSTLPHRLEFVTEKNGVRFVDDSKSTSCQSLKAALSAFGPKSVRLIAGGSDKGDPFEGLAEPLGEKVAFAALIGATAAILAKICEKAGIPFRICESMDEAVSAAEDGATPGQTVLLSPGCASFGMFRDYLDRAEKFRAAVGQLGFRGHLHVVGLWGIGVSAIARYYAGNGWTVSGSDGSASGSGGAASSVTEGLEKEGIPVAIGHSEKNLSPKTTLLVYSEAVVTKPDLPKEAQILANVEIRTAKERWIRCLSYPEALAEIFNGKNGIAVTGSHGKSTTTAMIGTALVESGAGGSTVVGTTVPQFGGKNGHFEPESPRFVIEACEYRRAFLHYEPEIVVITNIDLDHLDYYRDLNDYLSAFESFLSNTKRAVVFSADCKNSRIVAASKSAEHLEKYFVGKDGFTGPDGVLRPFPRMDLAVPGEHLAQDARLAYVALLLSGVDESRIAKALEAYRGSWRRSEIVGTTKNGNLLVSDYGHHPSEIRPTLAAFKERYPEKTLFVTFQPHQYSRTRELLSEFATAFDSADELLIPDIYFSRDKKEDVEWMTIGRLLDTLRARYPKVRGGNGLEGALTEMADFDRANPNSAVFVLLGAGTVDTLRNWFF